MELSKACREAGGYYDSRQRVCKLGNTRILEKGFGQYEIHTPAGRFEINGYAPQRGEGIFFAFNNCGIDITPRTIKMECFTTTDDEWGSSLVRTFVANIPLDVVGAGAEDAAVHLRRLLHRAAED